jgi:hypothetical protein
LAKNRESAVESEKLMGEVMKLEVKSEK